MQTQYLKEFVTLGDIGNFTKTSQTLMISQPVLSKHIKLMEEDLGVSLFERNKRSVQLSPAGEAFLPYARQILETERDALAVISGYTEKGSTEIKIGAFSATSQYGVLDVLVEYSVQYPNVTFDIVEGGTNYLLEQLRKNKLDVVFTYGVASRSFREEGITRVPFYYDTYVVILPSDHYLAEREAITVAELEDEEFYSGRPQSVSRIELTRLCRAAGFEPQVVSTSNNTRHLIEMVKQGHGIVIARQRQVQPWDDPERIRMIPLDPPERGPICYYYNSAKRPSDVTQRLLDFIGKRLVKEES